ncbi:hypothetical protein NQ315_015651 [Exocentrus adspersus]|uniref:SAP domain-containing protein n=1 Tax=Exocentrus adspersus TaxID=1586481 RepID=A0AAV8W2Y1_9CUCU|nr:hypothetical protein NQ315_015651 [Exocentrus adspersus]
MADNSLTDISLDISKLKVPDLKKELKLRGLSSTGNKNELIERLQAAMKSSDAIGHESVDDLEEDLLNDDDDVHLDASESVILENDFDDSPKTQKRKIDESPILTEVKNGPPKKIILNRNISYTIEPLKPKEVSPKTDVDVADDQPEKKVVKLSELSAKERLEMRAKKFGVSSISADAKKVVRAERFRTNSSSPSIKSNKVNTSVDVLKQRAERFGGSVSTIMSGLENKEKLERRKARFGIMTNTNGAVSDSDKAKQRLERFKQPIK